MVGDTFTVRFVRFQTCFLYVSERWAKKVQDFRRQDVDSYLKVFYNSSKVAYFSWQLSNSIEPNCIGINATVAKNLDLHEGNSISVMMCDSPTPLQGVTVTPKTADDLEMIESSSGIVQSTLLNQVRIVYNGQEFTIWISNSLPVTLKIGVLKPNVVVGKLVQMTDLTINFPKELPFQNSLQLNNEFSTSKSSEKNLISTENAVLSPAKVSKSNCFYPHVEKKSIFRVHPLDSDSCLFGPCDIFLTEEEYLKIQLSMNLSSVPGKYVIICKMAKLQSPLFSHSENTAVSKAGGDTEMEGQSSKVTDELDCTFLYVRLRSNSELSRDNQHFRPFQNNCVLVSNNTRKTLGLEIGSHIKLSGFQDVSEEIGWGNIELLPFHGVEFPEYANSLLKRVGQTSDGLLLCSNMLLTLSSQKGFIDVEVRLHPSSVHFLIVTPEQIDEEHVSLKREKPTGKHHISHVVKKPQIIGNAAEDLFLNHLDKILQETLQSLEITLGYKDLSPQGFHSIFMKSNVLISGKRGSGKTSTACALCYNLQKAPYYTHFVLIKCRPLRGKKVETIYKSIQSNIADCTYHQPSILILDDLDCIAGVTEEQDQTNPRGTYFKRVAKMLSSLILQVQSCHRVAVIATAPSTSCLSPCLIAPRGVHIFNTFIEQPELSKNDRQGILSKLLARKEVQREIRSSIKSEALANFVLKAEGYSCQDLSDLLDKAIFAACKREVEPFDTPIIEVDDIQSALSLSTPMLLRGISLHKESPYVWKDIGGLSEVKEVLKEVLQWPVMYPSLFLNSPLRHQSGLLLYGAPGTGKTMLAGAVANECGLNFISVKGPELLSKYIGASEASVRDIFQKAQSAKPCVLFFDEFDSLAPRRGHDSTGVTDRVVNQLLTQLDGVESLSGVWVLAATSRPDLLDPALLRPGRLDRSVLCPLPAIEDRLAILSALSRNLVIDSGVDMAYIAESTDGFTGADLQSILYTAQLNAVEESQSRAGEVLPDVEEIVAVIQPKHLDDALRDTRPSLSSQDRLKYSLIYEKFRGGGTIDMTGINSRATLA